ncbi:MAG: DUF3574 domain-containing protein [Stellaceae bacterium]
MTKGCHCEARSNDTISSLQGAAFHRAATLFLILLSGCAASPPAPYVCLLPAEQRMLVAELFFARGIRGRAPVTDAEWAGFVAHVVTPSFHDGFTVFDGRGQWRNPQTGHIARDPTKILMVAARRTPDLARRLAAVIDAYETRFHQQSVGIITRDSCAAF